MTHILNSISLTPPQFFSIFFNSSYSLSFFSLSLPFSFLLDLGLKILIETNLKVTNFLELTLNLKTGTSHPYRKPNDSPSYINIFCFFGGDIFFVRKSVCCNVIFFIKHGSKRGNKFHTSFSYIRCSVQSRIWTLRRTAPSRTDPINRSNPALHWAAGVRETYIVIFFVQKTYIMQLSFLWAYWT